MKWNVFFVSHIGPICNEGDVTCMKVYGIGLLFSLGGVVLFPIA